MSFTDAPSGKAVWTESMLRASPSASVSLASSTDNSTLTTRPPALRYTASAPATGTLLPRITVNTNDRSVALPAKSVTLTVIVPLPDSPLAGFTTTFRAVPEPPATMPPTKLAFEDCELTVNAAAAVRLSLTRKRTRSVSVSSSIVWSNNSETVGAVVSMTTVLVPVSFTLPSVG